ncbi:MAG TPA: class I SAM-dependent methyltransferase [Pseudonocardiaceae bacterium]|jgi:SAM-dependent methyltransferase
MTQRIAGDFDYETHGAGYGSRRRTDPRIAAYVLAALGDARTVVNVGAGAGSYEPDDREVTAVEPSAAMRAQRGAHLAPAVDATAQELPFPDDSFDAAMAMVTIHQWPDPDAGLRELRRVSRGPVVIMTFDGDEQGRFWLGHYAPELFAVEARRYPSIEHIREVLGGTSTVTEVPVPIDCIDGFTEAFYARPGQFLDPEVRASQSAWGFVEPAAIARAVANLRADLESGAWEDEFGAYRQQPEFVGSLRLVTALP